MFNMTGIKTAKILGVDISAQTFAENLETAVSFLKAGGGEPKQDGAADRRGPAARPSPTRPCRMIFTPNPEVIVHAQHDRDYFKILNSGDLVVADGVGIVIASLFNKTKIRQRTPGIDLIFALFGEMRGSGLKVYFLGGRPGVAEAAANAAAKKFPGITAVGTSDGYFDKKRERIILKELQRLKPDLILVGLGFPAQEKWIYDNRNRRSAKAALGCGGSLDVLAGNVRRAPKVFRRLGLEWFFRLLSQPRRFFRMLKLPVFLIRVITEKIKN
jgi:N-acetylglucosaminyldiphosphoundecaprenol N-acetyl-beta-D-mannosaminyltransferase